MSSSQQATLPAAEGADRFDRADDEGSRSSAARHQPSVAGLFRRYRGRMLLTYGLFGVENVLRLAQPFVLGLAINGLLRGSYLGLLLFVAQHLGHMLIGTFRRMYDTRVYTSIYTDLASRLIGEQRRRKVDVSRVSARSGLSRQYVEFFERHVPMGIRAGFSITGGVVMLAVYDWMLLPYCLALIVPATLLNAAYGRKTRMLNGGLHDRYEREVDVIDRNRPEEVRDHYRSLASWRIRLSDAEAINFSLMELFVLAAITATLVHFCTQGSPEPGDIFAVFRYVLLFIMGLDTVPRLIEQISRLRDIGLRMRG